MRANLLAVVLLAVAALAGRVCAADRDWVVGAGGGPLHPNTTEVEFFAPAASVWVATPLQPGLLLGLEAAWYRVDLTGLRLTFVGTPYEIDNVENYALNAIFRAQFPKRAGLSPFAVAGTGISWSTGGDSRPFNPRYSKDLAYPGSSQTVWNSSVELGLRASIPGAWPNPEIAVRKVAWVGDQTDTAVQPRFALVW